MEKITDKIIKVIERLSEFLGKIGGYLIFVLVFLLTLEVVLRNVFNSPTTWSYDLSYMIGGSGCILAAAMCLKNGRHIRVDLIYMRFSPRFKAIWNIILSLVLFFPFMIFGVYRVLIATGNSVGMKEKMQTGVFAMPVYPMKVVLALGLTMLLLQEIAELLKNIKYLRHSGRRIS